MPGRATSSDRMSAGRSTLAAWFAAGCGLAFFVPYAFTSALHVDHDAYYGIYFCSVAAFLFGFTRQTGLDLRAVFTPNWQASLVLGALSGAFVVLNVLSKESTPHPGQPYFAFAIAWRGIVYGVFDALLLTAFPAAIAIGSVGGKISGIRTRAAFAGVALSLTLVITAVYHLGYEQFRDDGVAAPEIGNAVISLPALLSGNPAGSVAAHATMHLAAVTHSYETDTFLPPQTLVDD